MRKDRQSPTSPPIPIKFQEITIRQFQQFTLIVHIKPAREDHRQDRLNMAVPEEIRRTKVGLNDRHSSGQTHFAIHRLSHSRFHGSGMPENSSRKSNGNCLEERTHQPIVASPDRLVTSDLTLAWDLRSGAGRLRKFAH
jgi:hypothetical protein